jgi:hypothetical protein
MIRRWSYLDNFKTNTIHSNSNFINVYFRKSFKSTVRFKRFSKTLSKLNRKKYNFRKIINSNYNLLSYALYWTRFYRQYMLLNKIVQLKYIYLLPINYETSLNQYKNNAIVSSKDLRCSFLTKYIYPFTTTLIFDIHFTHLNHPPKQISHTQTQS